MQTAAPPAGCYLGAAGVGGGAQIAIACSRIDVIVFFDDLGRVFNHCRNSESLIVSAGNRFFVVAFISASFDKSMREGAVTHRPHSIFVPSPNRRQLSASIRRSSFPWLCIQLRTRVIL